MTETKPSDTQRWRPTRAGLVNVWRYWDETFRFHGGRLLLRGPNGSGKSLGLELLMPFLFDANASPGRLTSAAKSRGGLFDRVMAGHGGTTRSGFAWIEFERGEDCFTVGVRLRASAQTRKVEPAFFTTDQRIGETLHLLDEARTPLGRKQLIEAIGEHGAVHATGQEHRAAVRRTLFAGFGEARYDALIVALLALRKEKLSQNLDLAKMSETLGEALAPLEEQDLAAVAEGFERLDRRRGDLETLERELALINRLAARRRRYARTVCARTAISVREAETRRDGVTRALREAETRLETAREHLATLEDRGGIARERLADIDAESDAIKSSESYKEGARIDDLQREADAARSRADAARRTAAELLERAERDATAHARAEERYREASTKVDASTRDALLIARDAGAEDVFIAALGEPPPAMGAELSDIGMSAPEPAAAPELSLIQAWLAARDDGIVQVRATLAETTARDEARSRDVDRLADEEQLRERRAQESDAAGEHLLEARGQYAYEVNAWIAACATVDVGRLRERLPPNEAITPTRVADAVAEHERELAAEFAVAQRDLLARTDAVALERSALSDERDALRADVPPTAPPPEWRRRDTRFLGAPLWQLVEVRDGIASATVDRLEAALTAAGLLDARIAPDGRFALGQDEADTLLLADDTAATVVNASLADLLVPVLDGDVPAPVVAAVLRRVAIRASALPELGESQTEGEGEEQGEGDLIIGRDGSFRVGAATGRGPERAASLLGAAARERRRTGRLAELEMSIGMVDADIERLAREGESLSRRAEAAAAEFAARPSGEALSVAEQDVRDHGVREEEARARALEARSRLAASEEALRASRRALIAAGARLDLPVAADALDELASRAQALRAAVAALERELQSRETTLLGVRESAERAAESRGDANETGQLADRADRDARDLQLRFETLRDAIGRGFEELLSRLKTLTRDKAEATSEREVCEREARTVTGEIGTLEERCRRASVDRDEAEQTRQHAHERFGRLLQDGMAIDADVTLAPLEPGVTASLNAARAMGRELERESVDDAALERANGALQETLHEARRGLGGRIDLDERLTDDGWHLLGAIGDGARLAIPALRERAAGELERGRGELAAEEEALFERTLAGSIRQALASRIRGANALVDSINAQLDGVRTAAGGVGVRLRWNVAEDQPEAVRAARDLLLRDPAGLNERERASLQDFVRARVEQARADLELHAPWQDRLRESLDYRRWHRFGLQIAHRDWEGLKPATDRLLSRLSTGERSIALHLPMLASIAAHYTGEDGVPLPCPRLILLDELFAGVDEVNRAQLFGTFTTWQLDAIFTSDHEWCAYASLDGIAIHYLHPAGDGEPVTTTRFTWDGAERLQSDG